MECADSGEEGGVCDTGGPEWRLPTRPHVTHGSGDVSPTQDRHQGRARHRLEVGRPGDLHSVSSVRVMGKIQNYAGIFIYGKKLGVLTLKQEIFTKEIAKCVILLRTLTGV